MRIYQKGYDLMSEMGRDLWEMGLPVNPKSFQNKSIEGLEEYSTKEITFKSYCLVSLPDPETLMAYSKSMEWAEAEFKERVLAYDWINPVNPGEAFKLRAETWSSFLNSEGKFDYTYGERFGEPIDDPNEESITVPLLNRVVYELKHNPGSRQAILPIFNTSDLNYMGGKKRIPCSMYYILMVRPDAKGEPQLHLHYHQRSSDFVTHFGNDVYLAWKMKEYMAEKVGIKPGNLYHIIDSLHVYKKDWPVMKDTLAKYL